MRYVYYYDYHDTQPQLYAGYAVLVYSMKNINTGEEFYFLSRKFAAEGMPGNMYRSKKCFHGWRGNTENYATYAHGVYTVKSVDKTGDQVKVTLNRKDIKKGED